MEIERKFRPAGHSLSDIGFDYRAFPCRHIEQAYLCTDPVVRIRREDDGCYLTYKGRGLLAREEYNLPLGEAAYRHMLAKADGHVITKKRYLIPCGCYTIELDVFEGVHEGLVIAEVEFPSVEEAHAFVPPPWLGEDVTENPAYHNSVLSQGKAS
ncbi:MAG: CYTH domain-containing protein [Lachnospiraceae bacterium]|jgi:CYTH domain-containing protein|nr:CYTH domain-containing protein [Lachnospiraceae bacterium]